MCQLLALTYHEHRLKNKTIFHCLFPHRKVCDMYTNLCTFQTSRCVGPGLHV